MKWLHGTVAFVGIAAAGGAAWWWQQGGAASMAAAPSALTAASSPTARPGGAAPGGPASVEVALVQRARLEDDVQAVGTLRSRRSVMLRPEVAGRIVRLGFADGATVREGQLLVQMDDTLTRAQLQQAEAQASIARTTLQRQRELVAQGFVSASAVDQSVAALEVAQAQVALARAQVQRLRILAPFGGRIGIATVSVGDYVKDGADLVALEDSAAMHVEFRLPERVLGRLTVGQVVEVSLDGLPGRRFPGRVEALDAALDAEGRALRVKARFDNPEGLLKAGQFARVRTILGAREQALLVPEEAVVPQAGRQTVVRLIGGADGQRVSQRVEVQLGLRRPGQVEVIGGLNEGDTVVTAGQGPLMRADGLPVRVVDLSRPASASAPAAASRPAPQP